MACSLSIGLPEGGGGGSGAGRQSTLLNGCKQNLWCVKCQCHLCFEALCNAKSAHKREIHPVPQVSL